MILSLTGSESFTLTGHAIDKLIRIGNGDAALLYLYMLKTNGHSTDSEAAKALEKSRGRIASAMAELSRAGLIELDKDADDESKSAIALEPLHVYTVEEMRAELEPGTAFSVVVDETQRRLGKILSPDDLMRLFGIYDNLHLPPEVILQLITHCISECQKTGDGRSPSVRYIEKAAYTWEREGLFTIERAEEYLKALEERKSARGKIRHVLQIRDRELSATEKHYVDSWIEMGFESDAIGLAYDKTVVNTGKLMWPYIDTILKNWNEKGMHTPQKIQEKEKGIGQGKYNRDRTFRGHDRQQRPEPNREEMERMTQMLEKIKEE